MRLLLAVLLFALPAPAVAAADVIVTSEGEVVTVTGDGAANHIETSGPRQGPITIRQTGGEPVVDDAEACEQDGAAVVCATRSQFPWTQIDVRGGGGADVLTDTAAFGVIGYFQGVALHGEAGDDRITGNYYTGLSGGDGDDRLEGRFGGAGSGGAGNDVLIGSAAAGRGHNYFRVEPGADLYVTTPNDIFDYEQSDGPVAVSLDAVANDGRAGEGDNVGNQAQMIQGSPHADRIDVSTAQVWGVRVNGREGDDDVLGSPMADVLDGGPGRDRVDAGGGNDLLHVGDADDLAGGAGRDELHTMGRGVLYQGPGYEISLDGVANDGERGTTTSNVRGDVEVIHGSDGPDRLAGAAGAQEIDGHGGDDEVAGGEGPDLLYGGAGADRLLGRDAGWDLLDCGDGADPAADGDEGDHLANCELFSLAPLPAVDRRAPFVGIRNVVRRGRTVRISTTVDEAATVSARVYAGKRRVGRATVRTAAGTRRIVVRLRRGARLGRTLTVTVTARDAAGNASKRTRRVRIGR